ncbi:MAG: hypothetical protein IPH74_07910 [Bacteroidetes bacterium]|nr:hypothetical protein [Bacteroidota bacterium]
MKKLTISFYILSLLLNSCVHDPIKGVANNPIILEDRDSTKVYFVNDILPMLRSSCAVPGCHDAGSPAANIDLTTYKSIMSGIVRGDTIVHPFRPSVSILYRALRGQDILVGMPTPFNFQISEKEKYSIGKWIDQGALNNECKQTCNDNGPITYVKNIRPLIGKYCTGCHFGDYAQENIFLENYAQVVEVASDGTLMNSLLGANGVTRMPELSAMPACEIDQIRRWIAAGMPKE